MGHLTGEGSIRQNLEGKDSERITSYCAFKSIPIYTWGRITFMGFTLTYGGINKGFNRRKDCQVKDPQ